MWNDLNMSQRAEVIQMAVKNGMRDLNQIRSFYDSSVNKFAMGGPEETIVAPSDNTRVNYSPSVYVGDSQEVQDAMNKSVAAEGNFAYGTLRFLPYSRWITDALDATGISPDINKPDLTDATQTVSHLGNGYFNGVAKMESMQKPGTYRKSYTTRGVLDRKPKRKIVTYTIDQNDINAAVKKAKIKANIYKSIGAIGLIGDFTQMLENTRDLINAEQKYNDTSNKVFNERVKTHPAVRVKALGGPLLNDVFAKGEDTNPYTVGAMVDAIYASNPEEEYLGEPSHHYDFTQSEEWANTHGYYPDARGHRDDRVKKPAHPSHPSRGTWDGNRFELTDFGMQNPNYTLFGLNDGGQDPQAILTYKGGIILPEVTVTPKENYIFNPYDNFIMRQAERKKSFGGPAGYITRK